MPTNETFQKGSKSRLRFLIYLLAVFVVTTAYNGQAQKPNRTADVENTKMGAYRALAQLSFDAFDSGDKALAARLARILERTWDRGEEGSGNNKLEATNPNLFRQIDRAMDLFIKPIIAYDNTTMDRAKVEAAYEDYVRKLKLGDQ
jgi:hypothetical protein